MDTITPYEALKRMKELTEVGVPFSFTFYSYSTKTKKSEGIKVITKQLIGYVDLENNQDKNRFFHLPLLLSFNNYKIKP